MTILEFIRERMPALPRTQRKVASFFLDNWEKVAYLSTSEVAAATGLSQASIVRATVSLGFDGFVDFQEKLRDFIQHRLSTVHRLERSQIVAKPGKDSEQELFGKLFQRFVDNLTSTYRKNQTREFIAAADLIGKARQIFVIGMRSSAAAAQYFGFNLSMIRDHVCVVSSDHGLAEVLQEIGSEDVVLSVSFPRYTKIAIRATKTAKETGAAVIAISDSSTSPVAEIASVNLYADTTSPHYNHSLVSVVAMLDILLFLLVQQRKETTKQKLARLEGYWESLGVFYKG